MKVKDWLIHKLGGVSKEEIFSPIKYTVYRPKVETIKAEFVDKGVNVPQDYVEQELAYSLMSVIKSYMKIEKTTNYFGEKVYSAKINIVEINK